MRPGLLLIDASSLGLFAKADAQRALARNSRVAHIEFRLSYLNALEVVKNRSAGTRSTLLGALHTIRDSRIPMLPHPRELLRLSGEAIATGKNEFTLPAEILRTLPIEFDDIDAASADARDEVDPFEEWFKATFHKHEAEFRRAIKQAGLKNENQDAQIFLDAVWSDEENQSYHNEMWWRELELPGTPPRDLLERSEAWKIGFEIFGAAIFFRLIRIEAQANAAGLTDLMQLIYLSLYPRCRILVTEDNSLAETANAVLSGRYPNFRCMSGREFCAA